MNVDPQIEAWLTRLAADFPSTPGEPTARAARDQHRRIAAALGPGREVGRVSDFAIAGPGAPIACRLFCPPGTGPFPVLVFLHGGGWIGGGLDTHDALCREIAHGARCAVIAPDYRLAPEHPFPAAFEDCMAVIEHCLDHGQVLGLDPSRLAVGGDSAGGNLAAAAVQHLRRRAGPRPLFQLLIYPGTDLRLDRLAGDPVHSPTLPPAAVAWCVGQYFSSPDQASDPRASPASAEDLRDLPPAFILTAQYDVLRDEAEAYAAALRRAGNEVRQRRYAGAVHGFLSMPADIALTRTAMEDTCSALRRAFSPTHTLEDSPL